MRNDIATDLSHERYVVEVDGIAKGLAALRASDRGPTL